MTGFATHRLPFLALSLALCAAAFGTTTAFAAMASAPAPPSVARALTPRPSDPPSFVPGEVLLRFRPTATPGQIKAVLRDLGSTRGKKFRRTGIEHHKISGSVERAVGRFKNHPAVEFIEPDYVVHADAVPNDPLFPLQWSLRNTGQQTGIAGADIDAVGAWDQATGSSQVIVAIIDSGMDWHHPDLAGNLYTNPGEIAENGIDDDGNGYVDDVHGFDFYDFDGDPSDENGHGTHVSGIIGAVGNNGIGIAGVAWRVQLMPVKFLGRDGTGATSSAIAAIEYAIDMGALILNNSWGGGPPSEALRLAIVASNNAGLLFVAAAGNGGLNNDIYDHYPSSFDVPNIIAVASSSRTDTRSEFSNFGATSVDLAAPGTQILSTIPGGQTTVLSGSSMAAPHVSGALALLKSRYPAMAPSAMKTVVLASTDRIPALEGLVATGGRLNVLRMMDGPDEVPPGPIASLAATSVSSDRLVMTWTATGDDGTMGTATKYDLRFGTTPIDETNFDAATRLTSAPVPKAAGGLEQATIRGLAPLTTYFVALKAIDEYGNSTPLSNVVEIQTTAPPTAVASPLNFEATLLTGVSETQTLFISNTGAGSLDFTVQIAGPGSGGPPAWLGLSPRSGSVLSGATSELTVTLNATGLDGGDYDARFLIGTNDPDHRTIEVPARLHVIAAPDIDLFPPSVTFGPIPVGTTSVQTVAITNTGFADLHVTDVSSNDPRITVDPAGFDLGPNGYWEISVGLTPLAPGTVTGTITLHSDDPDESELLLPVGASGILPGILSVTPPSIDVAIKTGAVVTQVISLTNAGGSSLSWGVRAKAAGAIAAEVADLSNVRILFDTEHGGPGPGAWASFIGTLTGRGAVLTVNSDPIVSSTLDGADVLWVADGTAEWSASELSAVAEWLNRGGSLLLEGEDPSALAFYNSLLVAAGAPILYQTANGATGSTTRLRPHEITRDVTAAHIPGGSARLRADGPEATVVIEDAAGEPTMVSAFVGRGRLLAVAGRLFADFASIYADNRQIASQSFEWLGGAGWISVTPAFGTTAAGKTSLLTARIDGSRMVGGTYRSSLVLTANDPVHPQTLIPVELALTAAPDIATSPAVIHFGPVFVGATHTETLRLENVGTVPLTISAVEPTAPEVSLAAGPITLAPGERHEAVLTYAPTGFAPLQGTVVVRSDDPDAPVLSVAFDGEGLAAPDISLTPATISASLRTGVQETRPLVVSNVTGSDLEYHVRFVERSAATSTPASEALPAVPRRTWSEHRALAVANSTRASGAASGGSTPDPAGPAAAATLPLVILDPTNDGGVMEIAALFASGRDGMLVGEITTAVDFSQFNVGGFLSLDLDQNAATGRPPSFGGPRQELGAEYEIGFFSVDFGYVDLFDAKSGAYLQSFPVTVAPRSIKFSVPLSALGADDGRMNVTGVLGNPYAATDWFPDRKQSTIGGLWLAPSTPSGTVAAGSAAEVPLILDARGLLDGNYAGDVLVESNDPDEPLLEIPALLSVGGAPVLVVDTHPVLFGAPVLGASTSASLEVGNAGTTLLTVSSVASDNPEFQPDVASFALEPGATRTIHFVFTPASPGFRQGTLRITHDGGGVASEVAIPMTGSAVPPPALAFHPDALAFSAEVPAIAKQTLTIENPGESELRVSFGPEPGGPSALGRGGPDIFGYRWTDSDQAGGPIFNWIDIRSVGTPIPIRNLDENSGPLPIGFTFPFYGRAFTTFNVCTHGYISFSSDDIQFTNRPLPDTVAPPNLLAVFWDDLNFAQSEHAYYYSDGERLVVQFERVLHRIAGGPYTFEAIIDKSGAIVYQYLEIGPPVNSATIGIQDFRGLDGLGVVFNDAYVKDRHAIRFMPSPTWLVPDPLDAAIAPGASLDVVVSANSKDLAPGKYHAALRLSSNDPERAVATLPVVFRVGPLPALTVTPATLEFGTVETGTTATRSVRLRNAGTAALQVDSLRVDRPEYTIPAPPGALSLAAGESLEVAVVFAPHDPGPHDATLRVFSDDPDGVRLVALHASATPPPPAIVEAVAELSPGTIHRGGQGQSSLRARIFLPATLNAAQVVPASVRLQGVVSPIEAIRIGDLNRDGRLDLEARFDRGAVERALPDGERVAVVITGDMTGAPSFAARGTLRIRSRNLAAFGLEVDEAVAPLEHALHGNAPNPFNPMTAIEFDVASDARVTLRVFTATGRLARTLVSIDGVPTGRYRTRWDGRDDAGREVGSGVYFARLTVAGATPFTATRRMLLVR